jgi:hypothetical protein
MLALPWTMGMIYSAVIQYYVHLVELDTLTVQAYPLRHTIPVTLHYTHITETRVEIANLII